MPCATTDLAHLIDLSKEQHVKDTIVISQIRPYLRPGKILEIGAGCGQLSLELQRLGYDVIASDIEPLFVEHMRSCGLQAQVVDAREITRDVSTHVDNVLTQGVSTLVTGKLGTVAKTYSAIHEILKPAGRLIFIFPITKPNVSREARWSTLKDHLPVIESTGFRVVTIFRSQILPSAWYSRLGQPITKMLEVSVGVRLGVRHILVLEKS
jgi:SAM-dependent methyltransferase